MMRFMRTISIVILLVMTATGCWSRRELNDISITVAMGIDKIGNEYKISNQIVNPSEVAAKKGSTGKGAPVYTNTETAGTIFEALRRVTSKEARKMYFSHLRMLVISEQLAREGIGKTLDALSRNHEFRTDFYIAIAKGAQAEQILEIYTVPQEVIPANKMFKSMQTSSLSWAAASKITIEDVVNDMVSEGKQSVVTGVSIIGNASSEVAGSPANVKNIKPASNLKFSSLAVFKKDRLIGWMNEEESKAYNFIQGKVKSTAIPVGCPDGGKLVLEVMRSKTAVRGKAVKGKPEVSVNLRLEASIADVECRIDLNDPEKIVELEKRTESMIKTLLEGTIRKVQKKYKVDIFGFGQAVHRAAPDVWKQLKKDWNREFSDLAVNVDVHVKISGKGTTSQSLLDQLKE